MGRPPSLPTPPGETDAERRLVEEACRVCGPLLSAFLLAGYGREESLKCRSFGVTATDDLGPSGLRIVEARSGTGLDLPSGREPLVFAAVLLRLIEGSDGARVLMHHRELLESLGRGDTAEGRLFVQHALVKYAEMTFVEVRPPRHGTARSADPVTITHLHPIVELSTAATRMGAEMSDDAVFRLEFGDGFVAGLFSGGLSGAVWERVMAGGAESMAND
jgi:hypothetical protein